MPPDPSKDRIMTVSTIEHASHAVPAHPPSGMESLDIRKLGMWVFLGSDCVFFATLITTYFVNRPLIFSGEPNPHHILGINFTAILAFILLLSSLTMVLSLAAFQRDNIRSGRNWLLATAALGTCFLGGQAIEFSNLAHEGVTLSSGLFGQCFLIMTGFHGTHVFIGVIWLLACWLFAGTGRFNAKNFIGVEISGLYWHFVDLVWVAIFTLVYLI